MVRRTRVFPTHRWQYKSLAMAYSVLLGLVLPFICWGTLATPGHPHRMAHLVFFMPPMLVEMLADRSTVDAKIEHTADHNSVDNVSTDNVDHTSHLQSQLAGEQSSSIPQPTQPVGRSVPDEVVSAMTIISPLFIVQTLLVFSPAHTIQRLSHANTAHLFDPRVVTPPPRHLSL